MNKKISFLLSGLLLGAFGSMAQQSRTYHKPAAKTEAEKQLSIERSKQQQSWFKAEQANNVAMPANIRMPGEFEESQAIVISWAFRYNAFGVVVGADTSSAYAKVSAQLCDGIQPECPVWIRVHNASDSNVVKTYMRNRGKALYNYRFFAYKGDDWWMRDFGPMPFYYSNNDSIGFTDLKYYDGRDLDDVFPAQLGQRMGFKNFKTRLNAEGGNLMVDGFGALFFSSVIRTVNADNTTHAPGWTQNQTYDTLKNTMGVNTLYDLKTLVCDGGTGHIDLYVKLIDEQTLLVAKYPDEVTAVDKQTIEDNVQYMSTLKSTYNRPFKIIRVEHPTDDDGMHNKLTCDDINGDARNFINGIQVNKTFMFPAYSNGVEGNVDQHNRIIAFFQQQMPGYKIIPIDSRVLAPLGGALHCITMQIPANNPITFWHPSVDGLQPDQPKYHIMARITNKSGIASASCFWRKNKGPWNQVTLSDSAGYFIGDINNPGLGNKDVIEYYLKASSVNGKTAQKPITAPQGYYTFYNSILAGTKDINSQEYLFAAYPNPATHSVSIPFKIVGSRQAELKIFDLSGKLMYQVELNKPDAGLNKQQVDVSSWSKGMYFYTLSLDGVPLSTRKLIVQ